MSLPFGERRIDYGVQLNEVIWLYVILLCLENNGHFRMVGRIGR